MKNPFNYTTIVTDDAFCNRKTEIDDLMNFIKNSQNVLLFSHRRYGKTSLIFNVFKKVQGRKPKIDTLHVDLYGTLSEREFISAVLSSLSQIESKIERLVSFIKNSLRNVKIGWSIDPVAGTPSNLSISFDSDYDMTMLDSVMEMLDRLSQKRKLVVVFDEFQEIANYGQQGFEKRLRKNIQLHQNISYIFCGSQRHILSEIFNDKNRAFYKSAASYPLDKISTKDYLPWVGRLFAKKGAEPNPDIIKAVINRCENHPMYVQQFLYFLWDEDDFSVEKLNQVEIKILQRHHHEFLNLWESLTINQKKTLKLILSTKGEEIFYAKAIQSSDLKAGSQVTRALEVLIKRDIVSKNRVYRVQDIMFKKWIQTFL
jgi:hypothetical protein